MKVITDDPKLVVPPIKEGDFILFRNECHYVDTIQSQTVIHNHIYLGITVYSRFHTMVTIYGTDYTIGMDSKPLNTYVRDLAEWGWHSENLLDLMIGTFQRWKYENGNNVIEYMLIENINDLELAFKRLAYVPVHIKNQLYQKCSEQMQGR